MKNRGITAIFTIILLAFYITIILFTFFAVLHIDKVNNFATALVFEIIGFVLLAFFIWATFMTRTRGVSVDAQCLSFAIVIAGALAGGD